MYQNMSECSICLEGNDTNDIIHFKHHDCNFKTHEKCICIWLMNTERCPICRNKINVTHYALHDNIYIFLINDDSLQDNDYEITYPYNRRPIHVNIGNNETDTYEQHFLVRYRSQTIRICNKIAIYLMFIGGICFFYTIDNIYKFFCS